MLIRGHIRKGKALIKEEPYLSDSSLMQREIIPEKRERYTFRYRGLPENQGILP